MNMMINCKLMIKYLLFAVNIISSSVIMAIIIFNCLYINKIECTTTKPQLYYFHRY